MTQPHERPGYVAAAHMPELVRRLPLLFGTPGTDPWDPERFLSWVCAGGLGAPRRWAARFLLAVWAPQVDWREEAAREGLERPAEAGPFNLFRAWESLDATHRAAILAWTRTPRAPERIPMDEPPERMGGEELVRGQWPGGTLEGPAWLVNQVAAHFEETARLESRWPSDGLQALSALAHLFPTLARAPGLSPWAPVTLLRWLSSPSATSGGRLAVRFLLGVAGPEVEWVARASELGLPAPELARPFCLFEALDTWDDEHLGAARMWLEAPFWP